MNLKELLNEHIIKIHLGHYNNVLIKLEKSIYLFINKDYNRIYVNPLIKNGVFYTNIHQDDIMYNIEVINGYTKNKESI